MAQNINRNRRFASADLKGLTMTAFKDFKAAVQEQFAKMAGSGLFQANVEKDELWMLYLDSFPPGSNRIFRERAEYDCQCCKQFIRAAGGVVAVVENELVSIWDIEIGGQYQVVANALSMLVKSRTVRDIFLYKEKHLGTDFNRQLLEDGKILKWEHFHFELPTGCVASGDDIGTTLSNARTGKEVFKRGLDEISTDASRTVLELIEQNSLYRGEENKSIVELFLRHKLRYTKLDASHQDNYCWSNSVAMGTAARIRNTAVGTLLVDVLGGKDLDEAVRSFETKVAPANYKRPTAVITKGMIAKAQTQVESLGIADSLQRRYAVTEDVTINNILFADRSTRKEMDVFAKMAGEVPENASKMKRVDKVDIGTFIDSILPKADSIELLMENRHGNNLMSLIAPVHEGAKPIFKWDNNFSWAYKGELTDSIRERVKRAGGNVEGVLRCSLSWFNYDDLDIHVVEPGGTHIFYQNKRSVTTGTLDVDMNVQPGGSRNAVENIVWTDIDRMKKGVYSVYIHNYSPRETVDIGFDVEIEFDGTIHAFHYSKKVSGSVSVAKFDFSKSGGLKFIESLPSTHASKKMWGISTQKFHRASMVMNSPNFWDGKATGNKHWFFILEGCKNDKPARGFFNEFLKDDLREHRKVFEVLGSKMKTDPSDDQLSGLGFSSTQRNSIMCKVTGSFTRTIKITI